ncbi:MULTISPECIES: DUF3618 domain-containing protein [unclassified Streptomyces]|uniref:DUF3618 domain-containing protein n=2 Tax=Streptomyces TaxID=1883 RepID=UPI00093DE627|nr:DUF3618 domain-containing protein [Streptomyces sp. TSRI0107]OKJ75910.1 hypothetical protein AMK31_29830 [Streptomyces sp. TSRI0107]
MSEPSHGKKTAPSPEELREQVARTRSELGDTVEAIAAKSDVKSRAQEKAAEVREQAAAKAGELRAKAAEVAHQVQDKLPEPVKDKASQAAGQARETAARAGRVWEEKAPEQVRHTTAEGTRLARDHRTLLLAVAGAAMAVWLVCRRSGGGRG